MPALYLYSVTSDRVRLVVSFYVVYYYIFICKSLWIKVSAKYININIKVKISAVKKTYREPHKVRTSAET